MTDQYLHLDAQFVKAEIAKLIASYPELADDESLRADTIDGQTNALRIIERALAERQDAEMMAGAIHAREEELITRRGRFERKADAMKALIKSIMRAARLDKLTLTEASLSLTKARQTVGIEDLDQLPQGFVRLKREADKKAIMEALAAGEEVPGAFLVTGDIGLMVRTK